MKVEFKYNDKNYRLRIVHGSDIYSYEANGAVISSIEWYDAFCNACKAPTIEGFKYNFDWMDIASTLKNIDGQETIACWLTYFNDVNSEQVIDYRRKVAMVAELVRNNLYGLVWEASQCSTENMFKRISAHENSHNCKYTAIYETATGRYMNKEIFTDFREARARFDDLKEITHTIFPSSWKATHKYIYKSGNERIGNTTYLDNEFRYYDIFKVQTRFGKNPYEIISNNIIPILVKYKVDSYERFDKNFAYEAIRNNEYEIVEDDEE